MGCCGRGNSKSAGELEYLERFAFLTPAQLKRRDELRKQKAKQEEDKEDK